jgi:hypothetical protein
VCFYASATYCSARRWSRGLENMRKTRSSTRVEWRVNGRLTRKWL